MENSELIEDYFTSDPGPDQVRAFENRIASDPAFAKEVAFYLSVHTVAREVYQSEKKQQFRELYQQSQAGKTSIPSTSTQYTLAKSRSIPVRKLAYYLAAAAVVAGISFGIYTYVQPGLSPQQLAVQFEQEHLKTLSVTMGGPVDSLQKGLNFYNVNKTDQALIIFEQLCQKDSTDSKAQENAGLAALRMKDYDKAMSHFKKLETFTLHSNPALFYQAVTLMDRNLPGDADSAKQLLQQVVQQDQEFKEFAQKWLGEWKN